MDNEGVAIESGAFWPLAGACVAVLLPLNASWYSWSRNIPVLLPIYVVLGSVSYFLLLRWATGMVMMYSIGHYGKPFLEVNGAIVAGFVLGYLAFRHRSFWLGALLHWSIALTMDLAVLWQRG